MWVEQLKEVNEAMKERYGRLAADYVLKSNSNSNGEGADVIENKNYNNNAHSFVPVAHEQTYYNSDEEEIETRAAERRREADRLLRETEVDEWRRKTLLAKWREKSFGVLAEMTGRDRHANPMKEVVEMLGMKCEDEDDNDEDNHDNDENVRRSVNFDTIAKSNTGDLTTVPVPPAPGGAWSRYPAHALEALESKRAPAFQAIGLDSSKSQKSKFVELKVMCARHFISRQPPPPPNENGGVVQKVALLCVGQFAGRETKPVPLCAGGTPPGWKADILRFHHSEEYSELTLNFFQAPTVDVGKVRLNLTALSGLTSEFKLFVFDLGMGMGEKNLGGGYHGQVGIMVRRVVPVDKPKVKVKVKLPANKENEPNILSNTKENEKRKLLLQLFESKNVTRTYKITAEINETTRRKFKFKAMARGTYCVVSSVPELVTPLQFRIEKGLAGSSSEGDYVRLLFPSVNLPIKTNAKICILREEDQFVMEVLSFEMTYVEGMGEKC